jgi:hypothetical protein
VKDGQEEFTFYSKLLLESLDKVSLQVDDLKNHYAALDKTVSLLQQAYEANLGASKQAFTDLMTQVSRITAIVEELSCREHSDKIGDFQDRISALEGQILPSKWATRFIGDFFQKTGWIFGAFIVGSLGYVIYLVAVKVLK